MELPIVTSGSAASLGKVRPVHECLARQCPEVDGYRLQMSWIAAKDRALAVSASNPREIIELVFFRRARDVEMQFLAVHDQAQAAFARDHLFKREPPCLAQTVRKRRRHVNGKGHAMSRQYRIGRTHQILVAAVEGQAHKSLGRSQPDRALANLVH